MGRPFYLGFRASEGTRHGDEKEKSGPTVAFRLVISQ